MTRISQEVLTDLKNLIYKPGYIYSLCLILFEDFYFNLNKIHEVDYWSRLSVKECALIMGFLVQKKTDFSFPCSPEETFLRKEQTYELMRELHLSFNAPQLDKLQRDIDRQQKGETIEDNIDERLEFFVKDFGMVEPMFYAGDGVYDFQYMEYLDAKYKYDIDWLLNNKEFDIPRSKEIIKAIKNIAITKAKKVLLLDLRDEFPPIAAKARKKLKKRYSKKEIEAIEREQLIALSFYRYRELFPDPKNTLNDNIDGWKIFYENLLDLFIIRPSDLMSFNTESVTSFLKNFSFVTECNESYEGPGFYNIINSRPLIKFDENRFFLPIGYLLPEAVYETPFYWMWNDKDYRDKLSSNRGKVGEEISYEMLSKVFGKTNTYKSVSINTKKGKRETDIDVLCLLGNKALCVQVKSKKLTLNARRGDFEQLSKDFTGAVQDSYNQGLISRNAIFNGNAKFVGENGHEIILPETINEIYIMGLTTENYPALAHQTHMMLVKEPENPFPLIISVFDLELLTHYLKDPYDFLYYVRQRTRLMEYFRADEEIVYLGYHLNYKLWPREGSDLVALQTDFGQLIDRNYYPYKTGTSHYLKEKDDPILNRWKDPHFDLFIKAIKSSNFPNNTDIVFNLLDWSGEARKNVLEQMINLKNVSRIEGKLKSLATHAVSEFGISYVITDNGNPLELQDRTFQYAKLRKYLNKADSWLGLGSFSNSPNLIDRLIYLDEPWHLDVELEATYVTELSLMKTTSPTPINNKFKIGRNDICPCKSGKKFKNCCMH